MTRQYARPLDAVDSLDVRPVGDGWELLVRKTVRESDPYMAGHYPGLVIYPAVFLMETVRQAVADATSAEWGGWLEIAGIRNIRLIRPMHAGDDLDLVITVTPKSAELLASAKVESGGIPVAEVTMELERA